MGHKDDSEFESFEGHVEQWDELREQNLGTITFRDLSGVMDIEPETECPF